VEIEGPKTEEDAGTQSNVVPFPRDWLGPREELIPFGRSAPSETAEAGDTQAPSGAEAFWGEESAEIHGVLRGPDKEPSASEPEVEGAGRSARLWRRRVRSGGVVLAASVMIALAGAAIVLVRFVSSLSVAHNDAGNSNSSSRSAVRASPIGAIDWERAIRAIAATPSPTHSRRKATAPTRTVKRAERGRSPTGVPRRPRVHRPAGTHPTAQQGTGSVAAAAGSTSPSSASSQAVSATNASPTATSTVGASPVQQPDASTGTGGATSPTSASHSTPSPASSSGSGVGTTSQASSARNRPSFGQNGTLGPGSSPDS
jgi:hypothetical protein